MKSFVKVASGVALASGMLAVLPAPPALATKAQVVQVPCSASDLQDAITTANGGGATVLRLAANCPYQITTPSTLETGLPAIIGNITMLGGPRTTISRDPAAANFRILDVAAGGRLRLQSVTVQNGNTSGLGGGIRNAGTLTLAGVTLTDNTAANGGAIANLAGATATIAGSRLTLNTTTSVGGGGVINSGVLTAVQSVISRNTAPINGGGVNTQSSGNTRLVGSLVERNTSGSLGGGISNLGTTLVDRTVVRLNQGSAGGGIATGNTNVTLRSSVVRDNTPDNCNPQNTIPGCVG
jgi:hypothetical protein